MRSNLLSYVMESAPAKILNTFHALPATEQGDKKDILRLMAATARELEK